MAKRIANDPDRELAPNELAAADDYIKNSDYKKAAIAAGCSSPSRQAGYRIINRPCVRKYINDRLQAMSKKRIADAEEVLEYLTSVLRGELTEQVVMNNDDGSQYLGSKDTLQRDRLKAAELIGKRWGLYTDKTEVVGQVPVVICGEDDLED